MHAPQQPFDEDGPGLNLVSHSLRKVLRETTTLCAQIRADREKYGESFAVVEKSVNSLSTRIRYKLQGNVMEGSGADDYRVRLNAILADYQAIVAAELAAESSQRPAFGSVFETGSTSGTR